MSEMPTITYLGEARDVVRGIAFLGGDLDGSYVIENIEFYEDDAPAAIE